MNGKTAIEEAQDGTEVLNNLVPVQEQGARTFPTDHRASFPISYYSDPDVIRLPRGIARQVGLHAATLILAVVLSVVATISLLAVLTGGVYLPQYSRYNQPTQVSQLGICVSHHGRISTPTSTGTCQHGQFVHVQPQISHP